ncbi:MAG: PIN domain-containing protein [bacterium]|nr:PIN domain-containing protein [bacterium]
MDIVLDTMHLNILLEQYFEFPGKARDIDVRFNSYTIFNAETVNLINKIVRSYWEDGGVNRVIASTLAFIEIARKFAELSRERFRLEQFRAFIDQPPEWFHIAAVEKSLYLYLLEIPRVVEMPGGDYKNIEWADAIHLATAMSRDSGVLATTDVRLRQIKTLATRII